MLMDERVRKHLRKMSLLYLIPYAVVVWMYSVVWTAANPVWLLVPIIFYVALVIWDWPTYEEDEEGEDEDEDAPSVQNVL